MSEMDKKRFVELAPIYYALAIIHCLDRQPNKNFTTRIIFDEFVEGNYDTDPDNYYDYLPSVLIMRLAVDWCRSHGLIDVDEDDFGPEVFQRNENWTMSYNNLCIQINAFKNFDAVGQSSAWLKSALRKLSQTYDDLKIQPEDFTNPDSDWEPLPLERDSAEFQRVAEVLDETIEAVRSDNGYSANLPEEREIVLTTLKSVSDKLKTAEAVSVSYLKVFLLPKVEILITRFKEAATGILATTLRQSVMEYLAYLRKKHLGF